MIILIIQTIILSIISLIGGIVIGVALVINKVNKTTPTNTQEIGYIIIKN